ncbi:temperature sensitive supressor [Candidatus Magnetomorum sp. HK-1]|nr:temperature sensitive supressor [Candidatus Magnetomorum sp. HK-1]
MQLFNNDYSQLDQPGITQFLFHPRKDTQLPSPESLDFAVPIEENVTVNVRFHMNKKNSPNILFFHGNGEIVSDYDDLAPIFHQYGLNFIAADYRGYGKSTGNPSASAMINDAHTIFKYFVDWLQKNDFSGPKIIMGRSLGSASALEIAANYSADISGLIIESGFASTVKLLMRLGIPARQMGITEQQGFNNLLKITHFMKPTLIIHAQNDQIIPISDAENLQSHCGARSKQFQMVPGADHNNILMVAGKHYFELIKAFTNKIEGIRIKKFFRKKTPESPS